MQTSKWLMAFMVATSSAAMACSDAPAPTVIIMGGTGTPSTPTAVSTDDGGVSSEPPVVFRGASDASAVIPSVSDSSDEPREPHPAVPDGATAAPPPPAALGLPCEVATYLASKCTNCHGNPPLPSALAALESYDDLKAVSKEDPTKNEAELSVVRMKKASAPMPPGALPSASDVAILEKWIADGYPKGTCATNTSTNTSDGGGVAPDSGVTRAPPPPSVFKNAATFAGRTGPNAHNAGKDCMHCHNNGGGDAPQFALGGTLYDGMGKAVAGAEVRLVEANGKASTVYTGTNGTFYLRGNGLAGPAQVGVRNAVSTQDMFTALQSSNGGACSSCHCTGTTCAVSPLHLP